MLKIKEGNIPLKTMCFYVIYIYYNKNNNIKYYIIKGIGNGKF
jgi:hypothetical protein